MVSFHGLIVRFGTDRTTVEVTRTIVLNVLIRAGMVFWTIGMFYYQNCVHSHGPPMVRSDHYTCANDEALESRSLLRPFLT